MNYLQKKKLAFMSIANRIKGFVQTVTGALPLTLTNCVDNKSIINYKLYGQCVQDGIPTPNNPIEVQSVGDFSKNLFDINSIEKMYSTGGANLSRYLSITDGILKNKYGAYADGTYIPCNIKTLSTGTYTFSCEVSGVDSSAGSIAILWNNGGKRLGFKNPDGTNWEKISLTFTLEEETTINGVCFQGNGGASNYLNLDIYFRNIQIEKSETATEYSQYNKYKIPVIVEGKNLFDINNPVYGAVSSDNFNRKPKIENGVIRFYTWYAIEGGAGFMVPVPPNAEFTVSFDVIEGEFISEILSSNNGIDDEGIITDFVRLTPQYKNVNKITYTQPSDKHYICILLDCVGGYFKCAIRNLQVELGSIATEYEPYHEPTTTNIYLDEPLRKIGDYADYIDYIRKKVVRNIFHCSLLDIVGGVQSGYKTTNGLCRVFHAVEPEANMLIAPLSRSMKGGTKINGDSAGLYFENQYRTLYCYFNSNDVGLTEGMSSSEIADAIKQYIQDNEIDIYYVLKTPIEEAIELPKIPTHQGANIITADSSIQPSNAEITYYSSLKE